MKTLNLLTKARYCGYILLVSMFFSCSDLKPKNDPNCGEWILVYSNYGNHRRQTIICDSLQMVNSKEVYVYVKGVKTHIFAKRFYPTFVPCR